jgi:hypothetical protein
MHLLTPLSLEYWVEKCFHSPLSPVMGFYLHSKQNSEKKMVSKTAMLMDTLYIKRKV